MWREILKIFGYFLETKQGLTMPKLGYTLETALELTQCCIVILQAGADVNLKNHYGTTALIIAVQGGFADIVRFLLEAGADPNISDAVTWA